MAAASSPVSEFYRDRCILITGATGFMGKVLVEKLLRSCPGIKILYLLIRPKAGQDIQQRLQDILKARLFDKLKQEQPEIFEKLVPICGDITHPLLGISPSDTKHLIDNVSVVFHSAATVKFDEALKLSIQMNVVGTKQLIELCHKMANLVALVHVSTAYCNCDRDKISEVIYPPPIHPQKLVDAIQWMDDELIQTITPKLLGSRPNTYTFTKALAEYILVEECGNIPVAVVRPSIVTAAWKEPIPGWIDNLNGPSGLIIGAGKGVVKSLLCYDNLVADLIPVDIPINLMITAAWFTATHRQENVVLYNCTSGTLNRITWGDMQRYCFPILLKNPMNDVFWYPKISFRQNRFLHNWDVLFRHYLPAYMLDFLARLTGRRAVMVKLQTKIQRAMNCLEYFTTHEWQFTNDNVKLLLEKVTAEDRNTFYFDVRKLSWKSYLEEYCLGTKQFILKEDLATLPSARKHINKMYLLAHLFNLLKLVFFWRLLMMRSAFARRLWFFLLSLAVRLFNLLPHTWFS